MPGNVRQSLGSRFMILGKTYGFGWCEFRGISSSRNDREANDAALLSLLALQNCLNHLELIWSFVVALKAQPGRCSKTTRSVLSSLDPSADSELRGVGSARAGLCGA